MLERIKTTTGFFCGILILIMLISSFNSVSENNFDNFFVQDTPQPIGNPRPDEVDLNGVNVWKQNSDVPTHNNLGFRVLAGSSLTIYPGVTVKFDPGTQFLVEGRLAIKGSKASMVVLTSSAVSPANGDWNGIRFNSGSTGYVNHSKITYSIYGVNLINTNNIKVANCSIQNVQMGVKIENGSVYNTIENNNISSTDAGMAIYDSMNNIIENNEIYNIVFTGIALSDNAKSNIFRSNSLNSIGERGISLSGTSNNNHFIDNIIKSCILEGIRGSDSSDNIFDGNEICSSKMGFKLYSGSDRCIFRYNDLNNITEAGYSFEGVNDLTFTNEVLWNIDTGLIAVGCMNLVLENVSFNSIDSQLDLSSGSNLSLVNCTFNKDLVSIQDTSKVWVYWYLVLKLHDKDDELKSANIKVMDSKSNSILPKTSVKTGICWIKCLGYIQIATNSDSSMNPYWFEADDGNQRFKFGVDMSGGSKECIIKFSLFPELLEFSEDSKLTLDIATYFNDFDTTKYNIEVISGGTISYAFDQENLLLIATPPKNWNGEEVIQVSATPPLGDIDKRTTTIKVTGVNDPPEIIKQIPNQLRTEDSPAWHFDLTGYGFDPDLLYGDEVTWSVSGINRSLLNVTFDETGHILKFRLVDSNIFGNDNLTLILEDSVGETVWTYFWVNITPENDVPVLGYQDFFPKTGSPTTDITFSINYLDIDGDPADYILLKINNQTTYQMKEFDESDKDVTDGKEYYYTLRLPSRPNFFWVECHDGKGGYLISDNITGPIITSAELGSLGGLVIDKTTGEELGNAEITLWDLQNSTFQMKIKTDATGNYSFFNLEPGINRYQIFASVTGYKDSKVFNKTVIKGGFSIQNFKLEKLPVDIGDTNITKVWINTNRTTIEQHQAISFTGFGEDLDGDILTYTWDFGDQSEHIIGKSVSYTFHTEGNYTVVLTVSDTDGNSLMTSTNISVGKIEDGNEVDGPTDGSEDYFGNNMISLMLVFILLVIIIIFISLYLRFRRQDAEEEARILAEEKHAKKIAERRRKKRERDMDFVDREKRNVEQVNIVISEMHRTKSRRRGSKGSKRSKDKKGNEEKVEPDVTESEDYFVIEETEEFEEVPKKSKNKTRSKTKKKK